LNKEEAFTTDDLLNIISKFQEAGCTQIHFTGGEPLVKMNRLEKLIKYASKKSECWILTSGLNLTSENANRLKNAGVSGVIVSLDHYEAHAHNEFRGQKHSYDWVMAAVNHANQSGMVTALSICMTKSFISKDNLEKYIELAKHCGVSFVQLLEPKAVGQYDGKDVLLSKKHFDIIEAFYLRANFEEKYRDYPVVIYHGFHQRKIGCLSGGNWVIYIDSAGYIDACPFCQTKSYDAHNLINGSLSVNQINLIGCPVYKKASML
jgi:MoaA/NifB/PqqE/SkfB family radical SAM enzyme